MSGKARTRPLPNSLHGRMFANLVWLLGGKGFGAVCSLVYLAILTRSLGLKGFGHFSLIFGTSQALIAIAGFQTWRVVVRYGTHHVHEKNWNAFGRPARRCRCPGRLHYRLCRFLPVQRRAGSQQAADRQRFLVQFRCRLGAGFAPAGIVRYALGARLMAVLAVIAGVLVLVGPYKADGAAWAVALGGLVSYVAMGLMARRTLRRLDRQSLEDRPAA